MIDIHAHLFDPRWYPEAFQDAMLRDFTARQERAGQKNACAVARQLLKMLTDRTGEHTLRLMDKVGIEKRVILILDWGLELGEAERSIWQIHEEILGICAAHRDRFIGFAGVDPRRSDAKELLRWAFDEYGAQGLKLHPTGGWRLSDACTLEIVSLAAERGLPVLSHLGKTIDVLSDENAQPHPFLELAARFPGIPFIAGHSGFSLWKKFVDAPLVPGNIYFDVSGWQERFHANDPEVVSDLETLHATFPGRVCFGTDSPFYSFNLLIAERKWIDQVYPLFSGRWVDPHVSFQFK